MSTRTPITFATDNSHKYKTIVALVKDRRDATKPYADVTATVRIGREYVELLVPDNVYSSFYNGERHWRTQQDVSTREQAWRARLKTDLTSLAERL